jgi:hypothetical protein
MQTHYEPQPCSTRKIEFNHNSHALTLGSTETSIIKTQALVQLNVWTPVQLDMHYKVQQKHISTLNSLHSIDLVDDYLAIIFQNSRCKTGTNLNSFSQSRTSCIEAFGATTKCSDLLPSCKTNHLWSYLPISEVLHLGHSQDRVYHGSLQIQLF